MFFRLANFGRGLPSAIHACIAPVRCRSVFCAVITLAFVMAMCTGAAANPLAKLAWDSPIQPQVAGHKVYYGNSSRTYKMSFDAGTSTVCTVTGLNATSTYYFAVTAYTLTNVESAYSAELVWSVSDQDSDGMADLWESLHFGGLHASNGLARVDYDRDGMCNVDEFVLGSNPTNADTFDNVDVAFSQGKFNASFAAVAAAGTGYAGKTRRYTLEKCTNLAAGSWSSVPGYVAIVASNQNVLYVTAAAGAVSYRTRVWLN